MGLIHLFWDRGPRCRFPHNFVDLFKVAGVIGEKEQTNLNDDINLNRHFSSEQFHKIFHFEWPFGPSKKRKPDHDKQNFNAEEARMCSRNHPTDGGERAGGSGVYGRL